MSRAFQFGLGLAVTSVLAAATGCGGGDQSSRPTASPPGGQSDLAPGLREVLRKRVSVAPSLITHVRCGDYGEIRSGGGHRASPALARPPDEECFVYVERGRRFHFIRFGERWTYVPRGVVL